MCFKLRSMEVSFFSDNRSDFVTLKQYFFPLEKGAVVIVIVW